MDGDFQNQILLLIRESNLLPSGRAKVVLVEEAVSLADRHRDVDLGFNARLELLDAILESREDYERLLPPFIWCIRQMDLEPERFDRLPLLWRYKWAIYKLPCFLKVAVPRIYELIEDMGKRYRQMGFSERPVHLLHRKVAVHLGDRNKARGIQPLYLRASRDSMSDDLATEADFDIEYYICLGDWKKALKAAEGFVRRKWNSEYDRRARLPSSFEPLVRNGRLEEAIHLHSESYPDLLKRPTEVSVHGEHLMVLSLSGNFDRAVKSLERILKNRLLSGSDIEDNRKLIAPRAALFFRLLAGKKPTIRMRIPAEFDCSNPEGIYDCEQLADWFHREALAAAAKFDARNGNDYWTERVAEIAELERFAADYPLKSNKS